MNSHSFEAADPGQPAILAAGQFLAFPPNLPLSISPFPIFQTALPRVQVVSFVTFMRRN